ncbi:MAG: rhombosortase [Burkholderiaceae bacterium]
MSDASAHGPAHCAAPASPNRARQVAAVFVLIVVALQALSLAPLLEYRRAWLAAEPWRWISAHWVHLSWLHAGINAAALLLLAQVFSPWISGRVLLALMLGADLFISALLFFGWPAIEWYRGLSGSLNAVLAAACVLWLAAPDRPPQRWIPALLLAGVAIKGWLERSWSADLPTAAWLGGHTVPPAHLAGAVFGLAAGLMLVLIRRR